MQIRDLIGLVLTSADKIRIHKGGAVIYDSYVGCMEHTDKVDQSAEVEKLRIEPEIRHRHWKEKGLMQPFRPEQTPDYSFSDLQLTIYYDIYI